MSVTHTHHILPKHMGGDDDPENLIDLSIEEHAEAHRLLWEKHGKIEDWLAWQGLTGQIGKEEILAHIYRENGKRLNERIKSGEIERLCWNKGKTGVYSEKTLEKMRKPKSEKHKKALRKPKSNTENMGKYERTEETREKLRQKALEQYSNPEAKAAHSAKMKRRRKCVYCGMESNLSNVTRHEKKCSLRS